MTKKRFVNKGKYILQYGEWWCSAGGEHCADVIATALNELIDENKQLKEHLEICKNARQSYKQDWKACSSYCDTYKDEIYTLKDNIQGLIEENEELKQTMCEVVELLSEEVDLFTDKATEHDINAYMELKELDNKDAYYMILGIKKAIKMLKEIE